MRCVLILSRYFAVFNYLFYDTKKAIRPLEDCPGGYPKIEVCPFWKIVFDCFAKKLTNFWLCDIIISKIDNVRVYQTLNKEMDIEICSFEFIFFKTALIM